MTLSERKLMEMGIASLLPGFAVLRELIEQTEGEYRTLLDKLQNGHEPVFAPRRRGRPSKASKAVLEAVAAAAALAAPEEKTVVPVKKRARRGHGRKRTTLPPMIGKDHVLAHVATELGYKGAWGLTLYMRSRGMEIKKVSAFSKKAINLVTPAQYVQLKRLKSGEPEATAA